MSGKRGMKSGKAVALPQRWKPGLRAQIDQRSQIGQRVNADTAELVQALGGDEHVSPQQMAVVERAVWLRLRCKQMEGEYANGQGLDTGEYAQLSNALLGMIKALGLYRRAKPVKRLSDLIASDRGAKR